MAGLFGGLARTKADKIDIVELEAKVAAISGAVAKLVGIEVGVVSELSKLESSGAERPEGRPRHDKCYHEDPSCAACR